MYTKLTCAYMGAEVRVNVYRAYMGIEEHNHV